MILVHVACVASRQASRQATRKSCAGQRPDEPNKIASQTAAGLAGFDNQPAAGMASRRGLSLCLGSGNFERTGVQAFE